jgi:hypothetical protein
MLYLHNSILWGNSGVNSHYPGEPTNDLSCLGSSSVTIRYTDMETLNWAHGAITENQINSFSANPLFVDVNGADNVSGTADDNFSIQNSSPCTDRADGNYAPTTDIVFRPRVDNPSVTNQGTGSPDYADVGAYEGPYYPSGEDPATPVLPPILHLLLSSRIAAPEPPIIYL